MNDFLNNNAGTASVICALIALLGTILSAVIGQRSGKKAAQKELEPLRWEINQLQTTVTQQAETISNINGTASGSGAVGVRLSDINL